MLVACHLLLIHLSIHLKVQEALFNAAFESGLPLMMHAMRTSPTRVTSLVGTSTSTSNNRYFICNPVHVGLGERAANMRRLVNGDDGADQEANLVEYDGGALDIVSFTVMNRHYDQVEMEGGYVLCLYVTLRGMTVGSEEVELHARLEASQLLEPMGCTMQELNGREDEDMVDIHLNGGYYVEISGAMTNAHPGTRIFYHAFILPMTQDILDVRAAAAAVTAVAAGDDDPPPPPIHHEQNGADDPPPPAVLHEQNGPHVPAPPAIPHVQNGPDVAVVPGDGRMVPGMVVPAAADAEEDDELMDYEEEAN